MRNHFQLFYKLMPGDLSLKPFTKFLYLMLVQCHRRKFRTYYIAMSIIETTGIVVGTWIVNNFRTHPLECSTMLLERGS